jgi:hypothetical protein
MPKKRRKSVKLPRYAAKFSMPSSSIYISSPEYARDLKRGHARSLGGAGKAWAAHEALDDSDEPVAGEVACLDAVGEAGEWEALGRLPTDVAMLGVFDSQFFPQDPGGADDTFGWYANLVERMDEDGMYIYNRKGVVFRTYADGKFDVYVRRQGPMSLVQAVAIIIDGRGYDLDDETFMDGIFSA